MTVKVIGWRGLGSASDLLQECFVMDDRQDDIRTLYRAAFKEYGTVALWNMRPVEEPTPADALAITKALRTHGSMPGRRLAERIEEICRAPH